MDWLCFSIAFPFGIPKENLDLKEAVVCHFTFLLEPSIWVNIEIDSISSVVAFPFPFCDCINVIGRKLFTVVVFKLCSAEHLSLSGLKITTNVALHEFI